LRPSPRRTPDVVGVSHSSFQDFVECSGHGQTTPDVFVRAPATSRPRVVERPLPSRQTPESSAELRHRDSARRQRHPELAIWPVLTQLAASILGTDEENRSATRRGCLRRGGRVHCRRSRPCAYDHGLVDRRRPPGAYGLCVCCPDWRAAVPDGVSERHLTARLRQTRIAGLSLQAWFRSGSLHVIDQIQDGGGNRAVLTRVGTSARLRPAFDRVPLRRVLSRRSLPPRPARVLRGFNRPSRRRDAHGRDAQCQGCCEPAPVWRRRRRRKRGLGARRRDDRGAPHCRANAFHARKLSGRGKSSGGGGI
jgi:hypothetical protein